MGSELSFLTSPVPGPSGTLKLLAIADHGHAEVNIQRHPLQAAAKALHGAEAIWISGWCLLCT